MCFLAVKSALRSTCLHASDLKIKMVPPIRGSRLLPGECSLVFLHQPSFTSQLGHWLPLPHTAEHPIKDEAEQMGWLFWKDKRPAWVQAEEREFIKAANRLKTLQVTPRGGMRIDPEELRDQILAARESYKDLVQK